MRRRRSGKEQRDIELYHSYCNVLKKYGSLATQIKKMTLYEEACEGFYLTPNEAGRIIRRVMKEKY